MTTIQWGIIGCGDVTEVKSGPGFQKAENSVLVAVMRRNGRLAEDYARRHGVSKWYDDGRDLIADPQVNAIYIATPTYAHKEYTLLAAAAGKPVYVEKPMAMNHAECVEMVEACSAAGVPLWVAYYRRTLPRFLKVKELIDSGVIGDIHAVSVNLYQGVRPNQLDGEDQSWRVRPEINGGGQFMDLAVHTLDFLDYALGPIAVAQGYAANQAGNYAAEDIVSSTFVFESGVVGNGLWYFNSREELDRNEIRGSNGTIVFSSFSDDPVRLIRGSSLEEFDIPHPAHVQQPLIQSIVDELNGHGSCPSTGASAARTNRITDQMLHSYYQDQQQTKY